jgi:hypothetical protein
MEPKKAQASNLRFSCRRYLLCGESNMIQIQKEFLQWSTLLLTFSAVQSLLLTSNIATALLSNWGSLAPARVNASIHLNRDSRNQFTESKITHPFLKYCHQTKWTDDIPESAQWECAFFASDTIRCLCDIVSVHKVLKLNGNDLTPGEIQIMIHTLDVSPPFSGILRIWRKVLTNLGSDCNGTTRRIPINCFRSPEWWTSPLV